MKDQKRRHRGAPIARPSEVYVRELSPEELHVLQELYHRTPDATIKTRCQIILLEASPKSVPPKKGSSKRLRSSSGSVSRPAGSWPVRRAERMKPRAKW